jgi:AraC-like DNA-binding protein
VRRALHLAFWRLRRFHRALAAVQRGGVRNAELALELGYYDQAHLNREFRAFTGMSPSASRGAKAGPNHLALR